MPATQKMPVLLTAAEFAHALRVEYSTVYRWARTGVVDSVRVGGTVRIPATELTRLAGSAAPHNPWVGAESAPPNPLICRESNPGSCTPPGHAKTA